MKYKPTKKEINMLMREKMIESEMAYWQRNHPDAKVTFNKKKNQIEIVYPLQKDFDVSIQKLQSLLSNTLTN